MPDPQDAYYMSCALRLGRRGLGRTAENPSVGCVIVKDGDIVGVGTTAPGGRPHAEPQALAMAGPKAFGATVYVTLEPCSHYGKSPPCAEALVRAGVKRVVIALQDCDERVSGRGHAFLHERGIEISLGMGAEEARSDLSGFFTRIQKGRPFVTLKLALSKNECLSAEAGVATSISGKDALRYSHGMRAWSDAIMVGKGTVVSDNPSLTCRLPGLEERSPIRIFLDPKGSLADAPALQLFGQRAWSPVWGVISSQAPLNNIKRLEAMGVRVVLSAGDDQGLFLDQMLRTLGHNGVNTLLVEGGARLAASFLRDECVDQVVLFHSPLSLPETGVRVFSERSFFEVLEHKAFVLKEERKLGRDQLKIYQKFSFL